MDLLQYFTAKTFGFIVLAVVLLLGFIAVLRLFSELRGGQKSFQVRHNSMAKRIQQTTSDMEEFNKTTFKNEQLHILALALQEALLICTKDTVTLIEKEDHICLHIDDCVYSIMYKENKQLLRSVRKTLHGQGHFAIYDTVPPQETPLKIFYDLREVELFLLQKLHTEEPYLLPPALRKK